jgi:hypothetical protein
LTARIISQKLMLFEKQPSGHLQRALSRWKYVRPLTIFHFGTTAPPDLNRAVPARNTACSGNLSERANLETNGVT